MTGPAPARAARVHRADGAPADDPLRTVATLARATMQALIDREDVWEQFFEATPVGLALADLTARYVRVNASYAAALGQAQEDLVGVPFADLLPAGERADTEDLVADVLAGRCPALEVERRYVAGDGERWVLQGQSLVRSEDGRPQWFALSAQDVTERHRTEQELRDLTEVLAERAVRDPLTGLANRTLVEERLRGALARDARTGGSSAVLFLDLGDFKAVNDRYGHAVGDAVLQTFASRLSTCVRPSDTVARLGGDEFVVLADGTTRAGLEPLVDRLAAALDEPIEVGTLTLQVGVSVGLAVSEAGRADPGRLIEAADQAMYAAKRDGRSTS